MLSIYEKLLLKCDAILRAFWWDGWAGSLQKMASGMAFVRFLECA
jgi:hypothetical protein